MDTELAQGIDLDLDAQAILLAASNHEYATLRQLLRGSTTEPANVKDPDTGYTPLHSAIASCEPDSPTESSQPLTNGEAAETVVNGVAAGEHPTSGENSVEHEAVEIVKLLLRNGAIWNELDANNETPGCIAKRLGLKILYEFMVDAGVRAEMLLNRLDEYEKLESDDDDEDAPEHENVDSSVSENVPDSGPSQTVSSQEATESTEEPHVSEVNSNDYLHSALTFTKDRLVDESMNGVMMDWESDIMRKTAEAILPGEGLRVLNIGHGMGIVDGIFQEKSPAAHHIIEAHPDVLESMKKNGWYDKAGVTVHEGKWQDVVPKLIAGATMFDAIYFDTFAEDYKELRRFFDEFVMGLLEETGNWSFFNGLGADRQICYDVYQKVVEMDLLESGYDVDWTAVKVPDLNDSHTWNGLRRPYWKLETYELPIITFLT